MREILPEHLPDGELSIVVFGPGHGEAIMVKLPDGSIGVVDGCREPASDLVSTGDPVRELLGRIQSQRAMSEEFKLNFVCLTHPHADHYAGLGRLLSAYHGKVDELWTVTHFQPKFRKLLIRWMKKHRRRGVSGAGAHGAVPDVADTQGLERVFVALQASGGDHYHLGTRVKLVERQHGGSPLIVEACGPAAEDVDRAAGVLAEELTARTTASVAYDPNHISGALVLRWGRSAMLLGGDVLRGEGAHLGWQRAGKEIRGEVQVVNVAHHASDGAHDDALWQRMKPALAVVTPFQHAQGSQPPRAEQIASLARDSVVAITSPPAWLGAKGAPTRMFASGKRRRGFDPKNTALPLLPSRPADAIRNAVAVSMDAQGNITRLVLAGEADIYLA